jgi:hypothetical protein
VSKKPCGACTGRGTVTDLTDVECICTVCGGTGIAIDDGALDADRAPAPPDLDDDAAREWLARWDAFAIAAAPAIIQAAADGSKFSDLAASCAMFASCMMEATPGATE